jgi:hypothetical protein
VRLAGTEAFRLPGVLARRNRKDAAIIVASGSKRGVTDFVDQPLDGLLRLPNARPKTGDCEHDPDIDDVCVARCFACGQLWCPDCGELFKNDRTIDHDCPAWEEMDFD